MPYSSKFRLAQVLALIVTFAAWPNALAEERLQSEAETVRQIKSAVSQIISTSALSSSRMGMVVATLDTGQVLVAQNPDDLLNPASNVKLFSTAAALARLGPEFRFETELYFGANSQGTVARGLYVKGKGDPSLTTEMLWDIASQLSHLGIRTVKGELALDDSYFDDERIGPGFEQEQGDKPYLAPSGALSLNFNSIAIHVAPGSEVGQKGRVELEPESGFFVVDNRTTTVRGNMRRRVSSRSVGLDAKQQIVVEGRLPLEGRDQVIRRKIDNPPLYFGYTLKRFLELRGIKVTGKVLVRAVPLDAKLVYVHESSSLAEIIRQINKRSNNFMAEQLLKTLGAQVRGPPGSWPKGVSVVEEFLAELGVARGTYMMTNGSGLNDANRFSARQTVLLLREMWKRFPFMPEFASALPIAGKDGTIRWRMEGTDAAGHLRAKTGTLEGVTSLSGYVETKTGQLLAFAVIVNDYPGRAPEVIRAVDAIGSALAAAGGPAGELGAAIAMAKSPQPGITPAPATLPLSGLKARLSTFYKLGRAADRRNVPFLRTALYAEQDPVMRMAVAEAIYLSDPDSETTQRTFLESIVMEPQSWERLRTLTADLRAPEPIIGSLADLAAEGDADAVRRFIELAPIAAQRLEMLVSYSDAAAEVGRTAPSELLSAFKTAPGPVSDAALTALARGLARARDPNHPFLAEMKKVLAGGDAELAAFTKMFSPTLEARMRTAEVELKSSPPAVAPVAAPAPAPAAASDARKGGG